MSIEIYQLWPEDEPGDESDSGLSLQEKLTHEFEQLFQLRYSFFRQLRIDELVQASLDHNYLRAGAEPSSFQEWFMSLMQWDRPMTDVAIDCLRRTGFEQTDLEERICQVLDEDLVVRIIRSIHRHEGVEDTRCNWMPMIGDQLLGASIGAIEWLDNDGLGRPIDMLPFPILISATGLLQAYAFVVIRDLSTLGIYASPTVLRDEQGKLFMTFDIDIQMSTIGDSFKESVTPDAVAQRAQQDQEWVQLLEEYYDQAQDDEKEAETIAHELADVFTAIEGGQLEIIANAKAAKILQVQQHLEELTTGKNRLLITDEADTRLIMDRIIADDELLRSFISRELFLEQHAMLQSIDEMILSVINSRERLQDFVALQADVQHRALDLLFDSALEAKNRHGNNITFEFYDEQYSARDLLSILSGHHDMNELDVSGGITDYYVVEAHVRDDTDVLIIHVCTDANLVDSVGTQEVNSGEFSVDPDEIKDGDRVHEQDLRLETAKVPIGKLVLKRTRDSRYFIFDTDESVMEDVEYEQDEIEEQLLFALAEEIEPVHVGGVELVFDYLIDHFRIRRPDEHVLPVKIEDLNEKARTALQCWSFQEMCQELFPARHYSETGAIENLSIRISFQSAKNLPNLRYT